METLPEVIVPEIVVEGTPDSGGLPELRRAIELILEDCSNELNPEQSRVKVLQKLNVEISNAVAKNGVNIFQMQQVNINNISVNAVKALQIVNKIESERETKQEVSLEEVIERIAQLGLTLRQFKELMTNLYLDAVIKLSPNKTKASKVLEIQRTYLSRLLSRR